MGAWPTIENCVTIGATAALVLGLYALGADLYAFLGLLLLLNLNRPIQRGKKEEED